MQHVVFLKVLSYHLHLQLFLQLFCLRRILSFTELDVVRHSFTVIYNDCKLSRSFPCALFCVQNRAFGLIEQDA